MTAWLREWSEGDPAALEQLVPAVYQDLRRLARRRLRAERPDHTLDSSDLVNELYLRLARQRAASVASRNQFFAICSRLLRRILVDHARRRRSAKRGGELATLPLAAADLLGEKRDQDLLALEDALRALEDRDRRKADVVELRFFGGLSIAETGEVLACSPATVERDWTMARAWLRREVRRTARATGGPGPERER